MCSWIWTPCFYGSVLMIFRTKRRVRGSYLFLFLILSVLTIYFIFRFKQSEGSFFPTATLVFVTLVMGYAFIVSLFSKIELHHTYIEINIVFAVYKISYTEIQKITKDDFPGRYFILMKDGKKAPISLGWFQNSSRILPSLYERTNLSCLDIEDN